jgi:hypothetical protein
MLERRAAGHAPARPHRLGAALVVQGGLRILEAIERVGYDVFRRRPKLKRATGSWWLARAAHVKRPHVMAGGCSRIG